MTSRRSLIANSGLSAGAFLATRSGVAAMFPNQLFPPEAPNIRTSFKPGELWLDTKGKPIQAHGGSIIQVGERFYSFGENKEFTTGKTGIWTSGVRCYGSSDLYNWDDLGTIIPPDSDDPTSPLNAKAKLDRPHIIHNARTGQFVCWIKLMEKAGQTRTVLTADEITGPYKIVRTGLHPLGMNAGDFDLVVSPDDGKAYMYFERVHSELISADLTDDYTDFTGYYSTHFPHPGPPSVREGPAYFKWNGKHYLATSGTTSYFPNPSESAAADTFHGPFTVLGDLHPGDKSRTSFNSQISSVFKHPKKKDLYIALADRWWGPQSGAEFESGETSGLVQSAIGKLLGSPRQPLSPAESRSVKFLSIAIDTSQSRYVWLPIRFDGERPLIEWRTEWSLSEFA
jgi:hypothetical protein